MVTRETVGGSQCEHSDFEWHTRTLSRSVLRISGDVVERIREVSVETCLEGNAVSIKYGAV